MYWSGSSKASDRLLGLGGKIVALCAYISSRLSVMRQIGCLYWLGAHEQVVYYDTVVRDEGWSDKANMLRKLTK